jgi:hypothetical protein
MPRGPDKPQDIYDAYVKDVQRAFNDELEGVIAFGDAATGDYVPGRSRIEFLISSSDASFARIKGFAPSVAGWHRQRVATPLIVSSEYIQTSLDSSPIEFLNMSLFHELVWGSDVLNDLTFDPEHLRVVCEREAKQRLQLIKQSYLDREGELKQIELLMDDSIDHYVSILRTLIHLRGKQAPGPRRKVFKMAGKVLNLSESVFAKVLRFRDEEVKQTKADRAQLFDDYVRQLELVAEIADRL